MTFVCVSWYTWLNVHGSNVHIVHMELGVCKHCTWDKYLKLTYYIFLFKRRMLHCAVNSTKLNKGNAYSDAPLTNELQVLLSIFYKLPQLFAFFAWFCCCCFFLLILSEHFSDRNYCPGKVMLANLNLCFYWSNNAEFKK